MRQQLEKCQPESRNPVSKTSNVEESRDWRGMKIAAKENKVTDAPPRALHLDR